MKRLLRRVTSAVLVASLALSVFAAPVAATGDCSKGYIRWYTGSNQTGSYVKYCFRLNAAGGVIGGDQEMSNWNTATNNLGPLDNGTYRNDFNAAAWRSGLISAYFYDNPNDSTQVNMCIYEDDYYGGPIGWAHTTGGFNNIYGTDIWFDVLSFFWTSNTSSSIC